MAHVKKYQASALGNMCGHYDRWGGDLEKARVRDNIDPSLSHLNYNLAPDRPQGQVQFIQERIDGLNLRRAPRKDAVRMCDCVVTVPRSLDPGKYREFFASVYTHLAERYGVENVISAYVHHDEPTAMPHMHYAWVPVTKDGRLSGKDVVSRADLKTLHNDLQAAVEADLGMHVEILLDPDKAAQKELSELEHSVYVDVTAQLELQEQVMAKTAELEDKRAYIREQVAQETDRLEDLRQRVGGAERAVEDARAKVERLEATVAAQGLVDSGARSRDLGARAVEARKRVHELAGRMPALRDRLSSARTAVEQALERLCSYSPADVMATGMSLPRGTSLRLGRTLIERGHGLVLESGVYTRLMGIQTRLAPKVKRARKAASNPREDYASISRVAASQTRQRRRREHGRGYGR